MSAIELVEKTQLTERPAMKSGDTVRVHVKVREGDKERIQVFEGVVIGMHRGGTRASFTVRKVSFGQGVERIFPLHSPTIQKVEVMRSAKVRRAKLYYLRELKGKAARMKDGGRAEDEGVGLRAQGSGLRAEGADDGVASRVRPAHARECASAPRFRARGGRRRGRAAAAWPDRWWRARSCSIRAATFPASATRSWCRHADRERLYDLIVGRAVAWAVAAADPTEIDRINIHQASLRAMQRAVLALAPAAGHRPRGRVPRARPADGPARAWCTAIGGARRLPPPRSWRR